MYTGWRRCIECLKLLVSFHKRATNYRALLRKMTYKDKTSYASSPQGLYRVAKMRKMSYLYTSFSAKEPYNKWLFCRKWPASLYIGKHMVALSLCYTCIRISLSLSMRAYKYVECTYDWHYMWIYTHTHACIYKPIHTCICMCIHSYVVSNICALDIFGFSKVL